MTKETFEHAASLDARITMLREASVWLDSHEAIGGLDTIFGNKLPEDVSDKMKDSIRSILAEEFVEATKEFSEL